MSELCLELLDLAVLDVIEVSRKSAPDLKRSLGLFGHLPDPIVDLAWLGAELIDEVRNRFFTAEVPSDDLCFLGRGKAIGCLAHES
jgi:hypothetical protein